MKKSLLFSVLIAVSALPAAYAQDASTNASITPAAPATDTDNTGGDAGQKGKFRAAFAQLDLSDSQKQQIKQIRTNTQAGPDRRHQIMAVLTPDQKQKLMTILQQARAQQDGQ
jgi:Spy/CpxP family protein refolding chaperone